MNLKKHKTAVAVLVTILALGVVLTYVPLIFTPKTVHAPEQTGRSDSEESSDSMGGNQTATLLPSELNLNSTSSTSSPKLNEPDGFSGLKEEDKGLDELDKLLGN